MEIIANIPVTEVNCNTYAEETPLRDICFDKILILGFSCEICFELRKHFVMDSGLFNWVHVKNNEKLLNFFKNPKKLFRSNYIFYPHGMYEDMEFNFNFHSNLPNSEFFGPNGLILKEKEQEGLKEIQSRTDHFIDKFFTAVDSGGKMLYILKLDLNDSLYTQNILFLEELLEVLNKRNDNFRLLLIIEKANIAKELFSKSTELAKKVYVRYVDHYAPLSDGRMGDAETWTRIAKEINFKNKCELNGINNSPIKYN